jgi:2-aminobenzoate-CoA ligase
MTGHVDTFTRDRLPPREAWPDLRFDLPSLQFPAQMNCAVEVLDRRVAEGLGARTAIFGRDVRWSYDDLVARSNRLARLLTHEHGLVPGNRVLLFGPNTPMLAACWFGIVKAGGVVVAAMPMLRAREIATIVQRAEVSHAICDARTLGELDQARASCPTISHVAVINGDRAEDLGPRSGAGDRSWTPVATAADDPVVIAFTSGTTGVPKATIHFHRDVMAACLCWPPHMLRATADDRFIGSPPLAFTFGLGGLLLFPLHVGASAVLVERATPDALPDLVAEFGATVVVTAPTAYRAMLQQHGANRLRGLGLRKCVSAGEALPAATRAAWKDATGLEILDGIGATEMLHIFISHAEEDARPGATGRVVPGYTACVVDEALRPLPPGEVGRLAVKGPTGCRYLDDPRQGDYVQNGWNFPGDAYEMDADGYFIHHGRTDDLIVSGGYNIAGPEVEGALLTHAAVAECGVVGVPDEQRGQAVAAFVVVKAGVAASDQLAAELQRHVKDTIAPYKYPRRITFVDALPRTNTGKLQRFKLREAAASDEGTR